MTTYTRAGMLAEIAADTGRSGTSWNTACLNKISAAIRHYQPYRLTFNDSASVTFTTTNGTQDYLFATMSATNTIQDMYRIDAAWIVVDGVNRTELQKYNPATLFDVTQDNALPTGQPYAYSRFNRRISLFSIPNSSAYKVELMGHVKIAEPTNDTDTGNPWFEDGYDLIMSRTKAELYAHKLEDQGNLQIMRLAEADALKALMKTNTARNDLGMIYPTQF